MTDEDTNEETTEDTKNNAAMEEVAGLTGEVDADAPDPEDLEPITKEEAEYERDADGELKTIYHAVQFKGEWRRVGVKPLVPSEASELEDKFTGQSSVGFEEMVPFLEEFVREPEGVDWNNAKLQVIKPAIMALNKEIFGGGNDEFEEAVMEAIEERNDGDEGN